ncbi:MAG: hypothetical protein WCB15_14615 [Desulfobacterales bacterium]
MVHKFLVATCATIWNNFLTLFRLIDYRTLLACLVLTIVLWPLIWVGFIRPTKPVLEIASVVITGLITFSLILRFALTRHLFLLWGAGFMAITMCREIHFTGSDELLLIGWPILLGVALYRYDLFKSYLMNPVLTNLLAGGILFYFLSQTIDQRWWKGLPGENVVFVPLEELIELFGHCTVGLAMLFSKEVRQPENPTSAVK